MDRAARATDKEIKRLERELASVYAEAERDLQAKLDEFTKRYRAKEAIYREKLKSDEITQAQYNQWLKGQLFQAKQWKLKVQEVQTILTQANQTSIDIINGRAHSVFADNVNYMSYTMERGAGVNFGFALYDRNAVANLIANNPKVLPEWKVNKPKDYTWNKKKVNRQITQGIIQGESLEQIAKRLATNLSTQNLNHMRTFARTAMTGAQNSGRDFSLTRARDLGINVTKEWMATLDLHTRDSHRRMDGEKIPVGDEFRFSNGLRYPGDPDGPAREVYNCRCTMVGDLTDYPSEYQRYDNILGEPIRGMSYDDWKQIREAEKATGVHTLLPTPKQFKVSFNTAKSSIPVNAWRVDDTYTIEDYRSDKLFKLGGGSTVAIKPNGDIISVCKNANSNDRGSNLLKVAVANGGDRLDAFGDDLYTFYTKNGFEPVSWTPFNEEYAPHDWVKGRDNPEPVIFYKYTGSRTDVTYEDFLKKTPACIGENGYNEAMEIRDKSIDKRT